MAGLPKLDDVIHFRVTGVRKTQLEQVAARSGMTMGELCRSALDAVEVLFDESLTLADVIRSVPYLKAVIDNKRDATNYPDAAAEDET